MLLKVPAQKPDIVKPPREPAGTSKVRQLAAVLEQRSGKAPRLLQRFSTALVQVEQGVLNKPETKPLGLNHLKL